MPPSARHRRFGHRHTAIAAGKIEFATGAAIIVVDRAPLQPRCPTTLTLTCERATDQREGAVRQVQRVGQRLRQPRRRDLLLADSAKPLGSPSGVMASAAGGQRVDDVREHRELLD